MQPVGRSREEYARAIITVLAGPEGELFLEDLELTYLYRRGDFAGILESDAADVAPEQLFAWLDGAASVVRRLRQLRDLGPRVLEELNRVDDEESPAG